MDEEATAHKKIGFVSGAAGTCAHLERHLLELSRIQNGPQMILDIGRLGTVWTGQGAFTSLFIRNICPCGASKTMQLPPTPGT